MRILFRLLLISTFLFACEKEKSPAGEGITDPLLHGKWVDTLRLEPNGFYTWRLLIGENNTFTWDVRGYGLYPGLYLSYWSKHHGYVRQTGNRLDFLAGTYEWWDGFYEMKPEEKKVTESVFQDCSYRIVADTLFLNYLTYPADAPALTEKKFLRSE